MHRTAFVVRKHTLLVSSDVPLRAWVPPPSPLSPEAFWSVTRHGPSSSMRYADSPWFAVAASILNSPLAAQSERLLNVSLTIRPVSVAPFAWVLFAVDSDVRCNLRDCVLSRVTAFGAETVLLKSAACPDCCTTARLSDVCPVPTISFPQHWCAFGCVYVGGVAEFPRISNRRNRSAQTCLHLHTQRMATAS